jgi:hypothetical protein
MKFKSLYDNCEGVWVIMGEGKEKKREAYWPCESSLYLLRMMADKVGLAICL